jgi:6-phospho-3-hexuloisomerase
MSEPVSYVKEITSELEDALGTLNQQEFGALLDAVAAAGRIALHGVGREGLIMRAFAMRLFHLGYNVTVVGDMTAPRLAAGDLLILSAGPGYFSTVDGLRAVAQRDGAKVLCLTAQRHGKTPKACDSVLVIPAQTVADDRGTKTSSILPHGKLV